MHIKELTIQTRHLANQKAFYHNTLGLPLLSETADAFTVQAGATRLQLQETQQEVLYHVAFTIPRNKFTPAKRWLQQRMSLLYTTDGKDEIFFPFINARSVYFCDASSNILEYMVHYGLERETAGAFGPADVLHVSEIGLPVEDVLALAARVKEQAGIVPYPASQQISRDFAYLGDIFGQLVVVKAGRPWLPTEMVQAISAPVRMTISGQQEREIQLDPYTIKVSTS